MARGKLIEYSPREVEAIRAASLLLSRVLEEIKRMVRPGVTTAALDRHARWLIEEGGA